jgi:PAS domain S-box-containing protein
VKARERTVVAESTERTHPIIAGEKKDVMLEELTARNRLLEEKLRSREEELLAKKEALEKATRSLAESEGYLLGARKLVHMGSWVWDVRTGKQEWSDERYRIFGLTPGEIEPTYDLAIGFVHPADRQKVESAFDDAFKGIRPFDMEYRIVRKDGTVRFLHSICSIVFDADGEPAIVHGIGKDITDSKNAEDRLRQLSWVMEQSPAAVVITDLNGRIEYVNRKFSLLTGFAPEEVIGQNHKAFLKPGKSLQTFFVKLWNTILTGRVRRGEFQNRNKAGELYWESVLISPVKDDHGIIRHFVVISEDITERKKAEERIKASLNEKEVLLKEVNHRVKNNLQIITSLLNLQSSHLHDERDLEMFKDAQNRLKTMAMIHEMLYKSKDLSRIDAADYIRSLTTSLFKSYSIGDRVGLTADAEEISLDIDSIVPIGLIVNELVTNSFKYAFPGGRKGEVRVRLSKADHLITLLVSDNGIGLKTDDRIRKPGSLGLELVESLTDQLNGTMEIDPTHGTSFKISFPEPL